MKKILQEYSQLWSETKVEVIFLGLVCSMNENLFVPAKPSLRKFVEHPLCIKNQINQIISESKSQKPNKKLGLFEGFFLLTAWKNVGNTSGIQRID